MANSESGFYWQRDDWDEIEQLSNEGIYHWWTHSEQYIDYFDTAAKADTWANEFVDGEGIGWVEVYWDDDREMWAVEYGEYREYEHH